MENQRPPAIFRPQNLHAMRETQLKRLRDVKAERDSVAVDGVLARLRDASRSEANLMEPIIDAVRAYATLGEMCGVLRDEWGEYTPPTAV